MKDRRSVATQFKKIRHLMFFFQNALGLCNSFLLYYELTPSKYQSIKAILRTGMN